MTEVKFYDPDYKSDVNLTYSVITGRHQGKWIFVRHQNRDTWEIPGGHIERGENSDEAARRELSEETGAVDFKIECVATYSVLQNGKKGYGRLYYADIQSLGPVPDVSEIAEIKFMEEMPDNLTYPEIQPHLFEKVIVYINNRLITEIE
jgi:8-oxo-dGTP diphosphatase